MPITHLVMDCENCRYDGLNFWVVGKVLPRPGETFTVSEPRPGRILAVEKRVPAWPVARLIAYRCPACRDLKVYDRGGDGCGFTLIEQMTQGTLF